MSRHVVASVDEIAPGQCKLVTVKGRELGIFNVDHAFFALINRCPHQGAPLCRGVVFSRVEAALPGQYRLSDKADMLRCPWHCWEFDIRTGQSWCDPDSVLARSYSVSVEPGAALAKGPFMAETVPVTVERDYVVVEM